MTHDSSRGPTATGCAPPDPRQVAEPTGWAPQRSGCGRAQSPGRCSVPGTGAADGWGTVVVSHRGTGADQLGFLMVDGWLI